MPSTNPAARPASATAPRRAPPAPVLDGDDALLKRSSSPSTSSESPPPEFLCGLTHAVMLDPVVTHPCGHLFDRWAIERWLNTAADDAEAAAAAAAAATGQGETEAGARQPRQHRPRNRRVSLLAAASPSSAAQLRRRSSVPPPSSQQQQQFPPAGPPRTNTVSAWLARLPATASRRACPVCNAPVDRDALYPCYPLKNAIEAWILRQHDAVWREERERPRPSVWRRLRAAVAAIPTKLMPRTDKGDGGDRDAKDGRRHSVISMLACPGGHARTRSTSPVRRGGSSRARRASVPPAPAAHRHYSAIASTEILSSSGAETAAVLSASPERVDARVPVAQPRLALPRTASESAVATAAKAAAASSSASLSRRRGHGSSSSNADMYRMHSRILAASSGDYSRVPSRGSLSDPPAWRQSTVPADSVDSALHRPSPVQQQQPRYASAMSSRRPMAGVALRDAAAERLGGFSSTESLAYGSSVSAGAALAAEVDSGYQPNPGSNQGHAGANTAGCGPRVSPVSSSSSGYASSSSNADAAEQAPAPASPEPWGALVPIFPALHPEIRLAGAEVSVGRHPACTAQLAQPEISTHHLTLRRERAPGSAPANGDPWRVLVHDVSTNGVFINGRAVGRGNTVAVHAGDEIALARKQFPAAGIAAATTDEFLAGIRDWPALQRAHPDSARALAHLAAGVALADLIAAREERLLAVGVTAPPVLDALADAVEAWKHRCRYPVFRLAILAPAQPVPAPAPVPQQQQQHTADSLTSTVLALLAEDHPAVPTDTLAIIVRFELYAYAASAPPQSGAAAAAASPRALPHPAELYIRCSAAVHGLLRRVAGHQQQVAVPVATVPRGIPQQHSAMPAGGGGSLGRAARPVALVLQPPSRMAPMDYHQPAHRGHGHGGSQPRRPPLHVA
ncbi:hypothetical protein H9P43_003351 [Blastocladiella emersonii ATCC 22665]|nr:hypothetical protein H9P43_003351 [Blastocladiella emersonii ATCC 22665]